MQWPDFYFHQNYVGNSGEHSMKVYIAQWHFKNGAIMSVPCKWYKWENDNLQTEFLSEDEFLQFKKVYHQPVFWKTVGDWSKLDVLYRCIADVVEI